MCRITKAAHNMPGGRSRSAGVLRSCFLVATLTSGAAGCGTNDAVADESVADANDHVRDDVRPQTAVAYEPDLRSTNFMYDRQGPYNFTFGDFVGDRRAEMVIYVSSGSNSTSASGYLISVLNNEFNPTVFATLHVLTSERIEKVFALHISTDKALKQDLCTISDYGYLRCFRINASTRTFTLDLIQTLPSGWSVSSKLAVGDFTGRGDQQVIVYDYASSRPPQIFEFQPGAGEMVLSTATNLGNLTGFNWTGGVQIFVANIFNRTNDVALHPKDDLIIFNETTRQIAGYTSAADPAVPGQSTFWWWYTTPGGFVGPDEEVMIGDLDGDNLDDITLHDVMTGALRFFAPDAPDAVGNLTPKPTNRGQLPSPGERARLVWTKLAFWNEAGNSLARDDAMYYFIDSASLSRIDARWDGRSKTYWWAFTKPATSVAHAAGWY